MSALQALRVDLVDKKLWPVALALLAALVAIPLVLAKPAPEQVAETKPPASASQLAADGGLPISDVSGSAASGIVEGDSRDPFRPQHLPLAPSMSAAVDAGGAEAGAGGGASESGGGSSSESSGGSTPTEGRSVRSGAPVTKALVRFGVSSVPRSLRKLEDGFPLPARGSPLVVYLGQSRAGTAEFLVSSDVTKLEGDARCSPDRTICSTLFMRPGDTEYLDVTDPTGRVTQYQLDYIRSVRE